MTTDTEIKNDTAVFYAMRVEGSPVKMELRKGTREAIERDGFAVDPSSLAYCPHQWIDGRGYVDLELAQKHPYSHRVPA
jgi:hypothetical protein